MTERGESKVKVEELQARLHLLARQKAHLELMNSLVAGLSEVAGLENLVPKILTLVMQTIGGNNVALYHTREGRWYYRDIMGNEWEADSLDDPLVAEALAQNRMVRVRAEESASFAEEFSWQNWTFPLRVQERVVGAIKLEGMQVTGGDISEDLSPFLVYVSLMLDHEISSFSMLQRTHADLVRKNEALQKEIAARKEAEERYRTIVEQSPDGILIIDPADMSISQFNSAAHLQLGYTREEFTRLRIPDFVCSESEEESKSRARRLMAHGEEIFESRARAKGGGLRDVQVRLKLIDFFGRKAIHCIVRDTTERKRFDAELLKAQKLDSVGLLAGGIAHDFNNLLTGIRGNITLAQFLTTPGEKLHTLLENAEKAAHRAGELTQQLLTFAKGGAPVKKVTCVGELVRESAGFAVRGSNVRCEFEIPPELWPCEVDPGQISQVLNNLVINADQAMPEGGVIAVRCSNTIIGEESGLLLPSGRYLTVSVSDGGGGISKDLLPYIFDPYFTTKEHGVGLGLATSYSVVKQHGGLIEVRSEPGEGTTFTVHLPAVEACILLPPAEGAPLEGGGERILVMDDEELVLGVACDILGALGYRTTPSRDGMEAVARYREAAEAGSPFAAVIMDLTVPGGTGGKEAVRSLLELDPQARVIVSSGYSNDPVMSEYASYGFSGVLLKPYRTKDLGRILAEVMETEGATSLCV